MLFFVFFGHAGWPLQDMWLGEMVVGNADIPCIHVYTYTRTRRARRTSAKRYN
jgi:hypothetical protein